MVLALAAFAKPGCIGIAIGCAFVHLSRRPVGWIRTLAVAIATCALLVLACDGQPLSLSRWIDEQGSRVFVLGAPHLAIAIIAWSRGATRAMILPLLASVAWASLAMAKHGSARDWLEPTGAAIVAIGNMLRFTRRPRRRTMLA
jgi:hypothetical protein